jgi:general secretion pathway protein D
VPRRQVYVEAVILDLSVGKTRTLGLSFHDGSSVGSATAFGVSGTQSVNSVNVTATSLASALGAGGFVGGLLGPSFQMFGQSVPSFGVLLQALEENKDVNVISRPHLLTMDNMKASISVGQQIVFQTSQVGAVTGTSLISNFQRQPVALTLELTPHLNESDTVRLEIDGNIEDVPEGQKDKVGGPDTNQRKLKTAVVVHDGETAVLGGLQKEADSETIEKIPLLGDIPLLGRLFQTRTKARVKQDLLIILTPYIIRGPEDLRRIECKRQEERQEFIDRFSAFKDQRSSSHIDYRRQRGLLEEVNVVALNAERDAQALRAAERALKPRKPDGPIEERRTAETSPSTP